MKGKGSALVNEWLAVKRSTRSDNTANEEIAITKKPRFLIVVIHIVEVDTAGNMRTYIGLIVKCCI